jgi:hypothetical protein
VFEDSKGVIKIRKSSKNRQHNGQKKKDKQRSTRHTHKTKEQNKIPELQLDQHVTAWTASWVNVNDWAHFYGHYLFLH